MALFEACDPGNHTFLRITGPEFKTAWHADPPHNIEEVEFNSPRFTALMHKLTDYTAVFIHNFFSPYHIHIANTAPPQAKLVWLFWGGEIWTIPRFRSKILLPLTRGLYYKNKLLPWISANWKKYSALFGTGRTQYVYFQKKQHPAQQLSSNLEQAIKRVDYIIPVFVDDFHALQQLIPCKARPLEWNYPCPQSISIVFKDKKCTGNNWLVGNSAHYSNNHIEMLMRLGRIKGHTGKVLVPLSYGDMQYRKDIIKWGQRIFNERFCPLDRFVHYDAYLNTLCSCAAAFFNTRRQQAVANIASLMYFGTRVFLRQDNPAYHYLKRQGAVVFSIQSDMPKHAEQIETPLDGETLSHNRAVIEQFSTDDIITNRTKSILSILNRTHDTTAQ